LLLWLIVAAIGHAATLAFFVNRVHAQAWPRKTVKLFSWPVIFGIPLGWLAWIRALLAVIRDGADGPALDQAHPWFFTYALFMAPLGAAAILIWLWRKLVGDSWQQKCDVKAERVNVAQVLRQSLCIGAKAKALQMIPGNEYCCCSFEEQTLQVPRLPQALAGLKIAQLSD